VTCICEKQWLGTASQIQWAKQIEPRVRAEFDRVSGTLEAVARRQTLQDREDTRAMIVILEDKRLEVLDRNEAGYFIKNWRELTDQVQCLILADPRFTVIRAGKAARRKRSALLQPACEANPQTTHCEEAIHP
jgi:hypothetical protein